MPDLLKAIGVDHYHIAYIRDDGTGMTSIAEDHAHPIVQKVEKVAQTSLVAGMSQPQETAITLVEAVNGHTHELVPMDAEYKEPVEEDREIIASVLDDYTEVIDLEKESIDSGYESEDYYCGRQWDEQTKNKLEKIQRSAVTINKTSEKIDRLLGYQRQNRTEPKFMPVEGGDSKVADILGYVVKDICEQTYYQREKSKVFEDITVPGRGVFNVYVDFDSNIEGDVVIERFQWDKCGFGPHEKEDLSDCDYIVKWKDYSFAKIREMYPEIGDKLPPAENRPKGKATKSEDWDVSHGSVQFLDAKRKTVRVIERWKKVYKRVFILANAYDSWVYNAENWTASDINAALTIPGFTKVPRTSYRMRITRIAGNILLEDEFPELTANDFHTIVVYAKRRNDKFWGKVENIKDLQDAINKAYSQFLDILNKVVSYGYFYDNQTFANKKEEEKWKKNATSPGFVQKVQSVANRPVKEEGVKFPSELVNAIGMFNNDLREIMSINLEMLGMSGGANQSGIAIQTKISQQLLGNDFLFDNLQLAEKKLFKIVVSMVQRFYSPERIMRILGSLVNKSAEPVMIGGQPLANYNPADIEQLLRTTDLMAHDIVITESQSSPTAMMQNFLLLTEMAAKGIPIPPEAVLEFAPIPNKEKIMQAIQASQQAAAQQEQMKYDTEIKKAMIAQEGRGGQAAPQQGVPGAPELPPGFMGGGQSLGGTPQ